MKKVVIVGFDGLDPPIVDRMLAAGELPAFARLRAEGAQRRLATTYPAETPVAFATFATGTNPGGHGIFDFVRRNPATYLPDQAFSRYEQKSRFLPPRVVNLRRGVPVWQVLTEAGVPSVVLRAPCTYGPENVRGRMLSGLGVPDLRGGQGTPTFYTVDPAVRAGHDEQVVVVRPDQQGGVQTYVIGPRHPATRRDCQAEIQLRIDPASSQVTVHSAGEPPVLTVAAGRWSEWLRIKFKIGLLQAMRGMVRFYLVRAAPQLELYASAVHFDPDSPPYPISAPPEYARELAGALGAFATAGMVEEHTGLNNGRIGEEAFLDQCQDLWLQPRADAAGRVGAARVGPAVLSVRHAGPHPAHVLAVRRARSSGQPGRARSAVVGGHRGCLPPLRCDCGPRAGADRRRHAVDGYERPRFR